FFSQANSDQAFESSSWSEPIELPAPVPIGSSPEIIVDQRDNIHVAYAIPLNEQRGIYFTNSFDLGQTWSNQVQVFDAQNARWDMVDRPVLSRTDNGDLHIIWTRYSLPSGEGPLELYYAKSQDDGETWSSPQLVVEGPVVWSQIIGVGERTVQRVWQQKSSSGSTLWHEQSIDGGETWERIAPVSIFGEILGNPSLSSDIAGRLHLLLVIRSGIDSYFLQHWVFDGQSWTAETSNNFQFSPETEIRSVSSDISDDGLLAVALLNSNLGVRENGEYQLSYTDLELDVPKSESITTTASEIPAEVIPTQIPTVQATEPAPPVIQQTPTQVNFPEEAEVPGNMNWLVIAGPVLVGIIALVLIILFVRWLRK
ncbi:MAG: exo-alpha-sialidase, partial [Chloroflexota bacterium]